VRVETEVPLGRVLIDRVPLDERTLRYANLMAQGVVFPAIKCALRPDGMLEIRDGRHRHTAAKLAGRKTILAKYSIEPLRRPEVGFIGRALRMWIDGGVRA
jgi:hypothetical protein